MFHTVYKITNLIDGKIYIGKHSCTNIDDGYMGSGKYIKNAIEKYGIDNFKKEILFIFDTEIEAYTKEKELVNDEFIKNENVYNLIVGGDSFEAINSNVELRKEKNKKAATKMNSIIWNDPEFRERNRIRKSEHFKKMFKDGKLKRVDWTGKKHKEESKIRIGEKNSQYIGEKNSQYGTCWIHNNIRSIKIKKVDLDLYLSDGWILGRKMKFDTSRD